MKTIFVKPDEIEHKWYLIDAEGKTLGRLASRVVGILRGKNKPEYSPHWDMGDSVVIINADKVRVTGRKMSQKLYYRHSRYPSVPWSAPSKGCSPRGRLEKRSSRG